VKLEISIADLDLTSVIGDVREWNEDTESYDTEGQTLGALVADKVAKSIRESQAWPELKKRVAAMRDEEIRARIVPQIERAMAEPIQMTNEYGQPRGDSTTLTELILKEVKDYLARRADTSYRSDGQTVVQKMVADAVDKTIRKELGEVIAEEKAKVVAAVRAKAADLIAQAVKEGIGR
jgi:hypothetical protein